MEKEVTGESSGEHPGNCVIWVTSTFTQVNMGGYSLFCRTGVDERKGTENVLVSFSTIPKKMDYVELGKRWRLKGLMEQTSARRSISEEVMTIGSRARNA